MLSNFLNSQNKAESWFVISWLGTLNIQNTVKYLPVIKRYYVLALPINHISSHSNAVMRCYARRWNDLPAAAAKSLQLWLAQRLLISNWGSWLEPSVSGERRHWTLSIWLRSQVSSVFDEFLMIHTSSVILLRIPEHLLCARLIGCYHI